jgi:hypothetical protein
MPLGDLAGGAALVLLALFYPLVSLQAVLFVARRGDDRLTQSLVTGTWAGYTYLMGVVL